jgi:hypothetical protein
VLPTIAIILGLSAFLFLLFRLIVWYSEKVATVMVDRRHREAEWIVETGRLPPAWVGRGATDRSRSLRKLTSLIAYMRRTTLVEDEESRRQLVERLTEFQSRVRTADWPDIAPPQSRSPSNES